jgi:hypothetical protein
MGTVNSAASAFNAMGIIYIAIVCWFVFSLVGATFLYWHDSTQRLTQW